MSLSFTPHGGAKAAKNIIITKNLVHEIVIHLCEIIPNEFRLYHRRRRGSMEGRRGDGGLLDNSLFFLAQPAALLIGTVDPAI